jgi:hypothetical protein
MVLQWQDSDILMVGPYGDWLNFPYSGPLFVLPEDDSCRVVTPSSCDLMQRVPAAAEAIQRIGSTHPAALLMEANEGFEEGETSSDENIRSLEDSGQVPRKTDQNNRSAHTSSIYPLILYCLPCSTRALTSVLYPPPCRLTDLLHF